MFSWLHRRAARLRWLLGRTKEVYREHGVLETTRRFLRAGYLEARLVIDHYALLLYDFVVERLTWLGIIQDPYFVTWRRHHVPRTADFREMTGTVRIFEHQPLISVLAVVDNPSVALLQKTLQSVCDQVYPRWELCVAVAPVTNPVVRELLDDFAKNDDRIKLLYRAERESLPCALNSGLATASGDFLTVLGPTDVLTRDALYQVVLELNKHPNGGLFYSDEDEISERGWLSNPYFKPKWSPESFMSRNYVGRLAVYRKDLVNDAGGFRAEFEGCEDYDLALRVTERTSGIYRIPKILYHRRRLKTREGDQTFSDTNARETARRALAEALARRGEGGIVEHVSGSDGVFRTRYSLDSEPLVTILIPTRDQPRLLEQCLASVFGRSTYKSIEVLVVDNGSRLPETKEVFTRWLAAEPERFRVLPLDIPFNYSRINNEGVKVARGSVLLFLNDDTEVITPDWIEAMLEFAQKPAIGAVGAKLLYPDGKIQHAGVMVGDGDFVVICPYRGRPNRFEGYGRSMIAVTNYSAVTGACLMCRRDVFDQAAGFEEDFAVAFNDVDLCLKFLAQGYRNVWTPHAVLYHHESKSRGVDTTPEQLARLRTEISRLRNRWPEYCADDPTYNPNLSPKAPGYKIRSTGKRRTIV